ncbi:ribosome maturation factor RimP [Amphibiibacter pelophylacis]|uniref:Ribosome maturation factor RimP n=1 Tax=Amphibiibacter pelophylacis TaxID=1799477 RepID=A0ACC6P173_9BURK
MRDTDSIQPQPAPSSGGWRAALEATVSGMGYDLVDVQWGPRATLQVTIDRVPGHVYLTGESEFVLVEDCERVTRQLQYVLEVENLQYQRLEVSSPGLDRPLNKPSDFERFTGERVRLTLRQPFLGRKKYEGVLFRHDGAADGHWALLLDDAASKSGGKTGVKSGVKAGAAAAGGKARKSKASNARARQAEPMVALPVEEGALAGTETEAGEVALAPRSLDFELHELQSAALVPVVDFRGRGRGD